MGEKLFTPRSLERVVRSVEWEDEISYYRDGTSNQQRYMMALAELWERWMRQWSLPDFAQAVRDVEQRNYVTGLKRVLEAIPERIQQLVGFYRGLWYGANPFSGKPPPRGWWLEVPVPATPENEVMSALAVMIDSLRAITTKEE